MTFGTIINTQATIREIMESIRDYGDYCNIARNYISHNEQYAVYYNIALGPMAPTPRIVMLYNR